MLRAMELMGATVVTTSSRSGAPVRSSYHPSDGVTVAAVAGDGDWARPIEGSRAGVRASAATARVRDTIRVRDRGKRLEAVTGPPGQLRARHVIATVCNSIPSHENPADTVSFAP